MPLLELIFKANLVNQTILTGVGNHIDINELINSFINPITIRFRIYLRDEFIKNYEDTLILDSSISCFISLLSQHTWNTIQILLNA